MPTDPFIKPNFLLSPREMTATGGTVYDELWWFNTNKATLSKTNMTFPQSISYRFDIAAYNVKGAATINLLIDDVVVGSYTITRTTMYVYSFWVPRITAGTHKVSIQLANFSSGANHCRVGLFYCVRSPYQKPNPVPFVNETALPVDDYLRGSHFNSRMLRGFNLSIVHTASALSAKNIPAAAATGANIGRYWITVQHDSNNVYSYASSTMLETLDSAVAIAEANSFYLVICLRVLPEQGSCDLWGTTEVAINRRNAIKDIWVQLANRYKDKKWVAGYDLINEPRQVSTNSNFNTAEYLRWQMDIIEAIRVVDPYHVIFLECLRNSMFAQMLPFPYENIVYSPHSYSPLTISHQGINAYLGSTAAQSRRTYPDDGWTKNDMILALADVRSFNLRFKGPIWIGEFSCINWAPLNKSNKWTSTEYVKDEVSLFEQYGWSWCYHAWREFEAWESEIPSQWYVDKKYNYVNAAPFTSSTRPSSSVWTAARSGTAPTISFLKTWFALNP